MAKEKPESISDVDSNSKSVSCRSASLASESEEEVRDQRAEYKHEVIQKMSNIGLKGLNQKLLNKKKAVTIEEAISGSSSSVATLSSVSKQSKREHSVNELMQNLFEDRFAKKISALEDYKVLSLFDNYHKLQERDL